MVAYRIGELSRRAPAQDGPARSGACVLLFSLVALACGGGGGSSGGPGGSNPPTTSGGGGAPPTTSGGGGAPPTANGGVFSGGDQPPASTGTIAYARGDELRLIEPDGSGDHLVWRAPADAAGSNHVTSPAWRPNGWEIAFSSDHESPYSVFRADIYAVRPDGSALRRLTNAPTREQAMSYPKGNVRVTVRNDGSSVTAFTLIVQGADPQPLVVVPGTEQRVTVSNVADLGPGVQQGMVVAAGLDRWIGPTVDVRAGQTVDASVFHVDANGELQLADASAPFWRSDSSKVGYVGPHCRLRQVASNPAPGFVYEPLVSTAAFFRVCPGEWGPTAATSSQLIAVDGSDYEDTSVIHIVQMSEGATSKPAPSLSLDPTLQVVDLHWRRDGSGVVFARRNSPTDTNVNLWDYSSANRTATQLTDVQFPFGVMQRFSISPDGNRIAFEMVHPLYGDDPFLGFCDLWVMNRDGSGQRLLAEDAQYPAWNPLR